MKRSICTFFALLVVSTAAAGIETKCFLDITNKCPGNYTFSLYKSGSAEEPFVANFGVIHGRVTVGVDCAQIAGSQIVLWAINGDKGYPIDPYIVGLKLGASVYGSYSIELGFPYNFKGLTSCPK